MTSKTCVIMNTEYKLLKNEIKQYLKLIRQRANSLNIDIPIFDSCCIVDSVSHLAQLQISIPSGWSEGSSSFHVTSFQHPGVLVSLNFRKIK